MVRFCFIPALAPILGSWLTQQFGWRSNFSFMAIFAVVAGLIIILKMKETNPATEKQAVFKLERYLSVLKNPELCFPRITLHVSDGGDLSLRHFGTCGFKWKTWA